MTCLNPIVGPLGIKRAKHLLERTCFGVTLSSVNLFSTLNIQEALDLLLTDKPIPSVPICIDPEDPDVAYGETWINAPFNNSVNSSRLRSLRAWWLSLYTGQNVSLTEKMHLFWHNHFATEIVVVRRPRFIYHYVKLLYGQATGNFRQLIKDIAISPAMLRYLDGNNNVAVSPNENFARELFELFSIGKGPMLTEGNYTYYTENDIQEAARVLTGWKINNNTAESFFNSSQHDKGLKVFSEFYSGHSISNLEENEYIALIDMILSKEETAAHIVRKLYRWFIYHEIDEETEETVIKPLAGIFYNADYNIKTILTDLLGSEHFFSESFYGACIKNPLEHLLGTLRRMEVEMPSNIFAFYDICTLLHNQARNQEMRLGDPPDVAGWPQWYLSPQYGRLWINSVTLPLKSQFTNNMNGSGYTRQGEKIVIDPLIIASQLKNPSDANSLIREIGILLLPFEPEEDRINQLKEILIPGLPDFEWTIEWNNYINNPGNQQQSEAVASSLKRVIQEMMNFPDYNLM